MFYAVASPTSDNDISFLLFSETYAHGSSRDWSGIHLLERYNVPEVTGKISHVSLASSVLSR